MKIIRTAVLCGSVLLLTVGAIGAPSQAASSNVVQVNVAGQSTPIFGVLEGRPALGGGSGYYVGPGPAAQITAYYNSGQYAADQSAVAAAAQSFFSSWMQSHCKSATNCSGKKAAAVFDIDDTLTSSYSALLPGGFVQSTALDTAVANCTTPAITPVVNFLKYVKSKGVAFFLITGRPSAAQSVTTACMNQIGVSGWSQLIMRSPAQENLTAQQYKSAARAQIQQSGYTIITSIGDQVSDSAGGSAQRGFLLPNPMYYVP